MGTPCTIVAIPAPLSASNFGKSSPAPFLMISLSRTVSKRLKLSLKRRSLLKARPKQPCRKSLMRRPLQRQLKRRRRKTRRKRIGKRAKRKRRRRRRKRAKRRKKRRVIFELHQSCNDSSSRLCA